MRLTRACRLVNRRPVGIVADLRLFPPPSVQDRPQMFIAKDRVKS
jgi:hypothetical protein